VTDEPDPFPLKNDLRQIRPGSFFYLQRGRKNRREFIRRLRRWGGGRGKRRGRFCPQITQRGIKKTGDVLSADYTDYADEEEGDEKRCPVCA
jgi:hypothetical protein